MIQIAYLLAHGAEDAASGGVLAPVMVGGLAVAILAGVLSVPVVLKRLAFIGQGISHAAFGGVGLAAITGFGLDSALNSTGYYGLIGGFCIATALGIAWFSHKRGLEEDTVIGIFLVASMAIGFLLMFLHERRHAHEGLSVHGHSHADGSMHVQVEDVLFGSLMNITWFDAIAACTVLVVSLAALFVVRRPMLFWAFDETAADAFGVHTGRMRAILMIMLAVAIVTAMKLAGVLLATAVLVLPGAAALRLSVRLSQVFLLAGAISAAGLIGGLQLAVGFALPPGPCVVLLLVGLFGMSWLASRIGLTMRA